MLRMQLNHYDDIVYCPKYKCEGFGWIDTECNEPVICPDCGFEWFDEA